MENLNCRNASRLVALTLIFGMMCLATTVPHSFAQQNSASVDQYQQQVKPLLKARCYACHGALKQEGGLRLDTATSILAGGDSGNAVVAGQPEASLLLERLSSEDEGIRMPPLHEGEAWNEEQIGIVREWIQSGAARPEDEEAESDPRSHWAFQPIRRPEIPAAREGDDEDTGQNPVDQFLWAAQQDLNLTPQPLAPERLQVRRLYLDLVGVPPGPQDLESYFADPSTDRYERLVDRLLEDPRYGQRWARHWMDVWRYSDWWGLDQEHRNSQKHIWHWRDWIVESLNQDMGYDEMIRQMLAADELYPEDMDKMRATGFLARNWFLYNRNQWMEETVEHVSKGLLGLTLNCTKCHDHKYDAIQQEDFYRMRAFFEPYHVRLDMVPGQLDLKKDGIPRVFDGELETATYRFERGEERQPDRSKAILPGVPQLIDFGDLEIEPVTLPDAAWQPGRRKWVIENYRQEAGRQIEQVQLEIDQLKTRREPLVRKKADLEANPPKIAERETLLEDSFQALEPDRWTTIGGSWLTELGEVKQTTDGPTRSLMQWKGALPRDFDVTFEVKIQGGSRWRSVGLSFNLPVQSDQKEDTFPTEWESELHVYLSAVEGGTKVQASYYQAGQWHYPGGTGMQNRPVELNRRYRIQVQVRDRLVNVSVDDQPVLAWRAPVERISGTFQLTTFDALAAFDSVKVETLPLEIPLRLPEGEEPGEPETLLAALESLKLLDQRLMQLERQARLHELTQSKWRRMAEALDREEAGEDAEMLWKQAWEVEAEYERERLRAEVQAIEAKRDSLDGEARDKAGQQLASLEKDLQSWQVKQWSRGDRPAFPAGAAWSVTRFKNSSADDPAISFPPTSSGRRTALVKWLTDQRHPLTARVAVNHIWMRHMGEPLVSTVFDFGRNGSPPNQPLLLDWLASRLRDNHWQMKDLHRIIVTSEAYRRSSSLKDADDAMKKDPGNSTYWRKPAIRLESQVIRDSLLAVAGQLDDQAGGPPVLPKDQAASRRRSLYFFHSNNERNSFLSTFDEALVTDCYRRDQSVVPQQALALINSELVAEMAPAIAANLSEDGQADDRFVELSFQVLLGFTPSDEEMARALDAMRQWSELEDSDPMRVRGQLVWALLNHNDFVMLR